MTNQYTIHCECGAIVAQLSGKPRVRGHCHCDDCRELLDVPYHSVTAWNKNQITISQGLQSLLEYQHPQLDMKRYFCSHCGETLFNSNAMDWRIVSQHLIRKCNNGKLPEELSSESHFFYNSRIIDIDDDLPKHS